MTLGDLAGHRATLLQGPRFVGTGPGHRGPDGGVVRQRRLRRLRRRGHAQPRRLRGRGPPGRPRAAAPWRVPRPLRGHDAARAPRARCARRWRRVPEPAPDLPLRGIRVIDAATLAAGPMVATMLGEFGAEVIKVEQPGIGDPLRTWGDQKDGIGLFWKSMSRNKQCVTLDLRGGRRPGAVPPSPRRHRRLRGEQPAERARQVGPRLRVGARRTSAGRDAARERVRPRRPQERPARLRHPRRGDERVRPRDGPARRPARRCRRSSWPTASRRSRRRPP